MKRTILITGGARSGKSTEAERLALSLSPHPVYMATARVWDDEFRERIRRHLERRGAAWTTIEEDRELSAHDVAGRVVVVDCLTLWATNFFFDMRESPIDEVYEAVSAELCRLLAQDATFILVTNEIGLGGTPADPVQRRFTDLLGWVNQRAASLADEVRLMVCGIAVNLKSQST